MCLDRIVPFKISYNYMVDFAGKIWYNYVSV